MPGDTSKICASRQQYTGGMACAHRVCARPSRRHIGEALMIVLKNILVATDFSEPSANALAYGRDLARAYNATLHVLHVTENIMLRYAP